MREAQLWQWQGKLDRAIADATKAIELETNNSYARVERGNFLLNAKKYAEAASDLTKAIALGSNAAVAHVALGMIHVEKKEFARADSEFHKAIELDPKHPDAYAGNASLYLMRGKGAAAISVLNQAIVADPQNPEPYGHRASVYLLLGNDAKALADLNEVIRLAPHSARALRQRAWILITSADVKNRRPKQAVASATLCLRADRVERATGTYRTGSLPAQRPVISQARSGRSRRHSTACKTRKRAACIASCSNGTRPQSLITA